MAGNFQSLEIPTTWGSISISIKSGRVTECALPRLDTAPAKPFRFVKTSTGVAHGCHSLRSLLLNTEASLPLVESRLRERAPSEWKRNPHPEITEFVKSVFQGLETKVPIIGNLPGTDFQRSVWQEITLIPRGETRTYGALAKTIGNPGAVRAVGSACGANPVPLFIPCHRVVAANGLGGFGSGLPWKRLLLKLEGVL